MENITFEMVARLWLTEKKHFVKKSTYAAYSLTVAKHLVPEFGRLEDITEERVQHYVFSKLDCGLRQKSVKDMLVVLKMVLKYGVKNGFMERRDIEIKCDYKTLSALLGHSKISTTLDLYVHPNLEQKQQCVEQMFRRLR